MKRILSALLAGALAAAVLVCPALAADAAPWVQISGRSVSLQDVPERCSGIQLTLTLDKEAPSSFSFNSAVSSGDAHAVCTAAGKELTLYVTSKGLLGQNGSVALGSLADSGFTVKSVSGLKLIGMDSAGFGSGGTVTYDSVEVKSVSGQGGSSSGPGGSWGGGSSGGGVARYPVGTAAGSGGALQISSTHAAQGETVTVTATPDAGWLLSSLTVTGSGGQGVSAASLGGGKWSFTMPGCAVTVSAAFSPAQGSLPFNDVGQDDWFREAGAYVYGAGLMNGTAHHSGADGGHPLPLRPAPGDGREPEGGSVRLRRRGPGQRLRRGRHGLGGGHGADRRRGQPHPPARRLRHPGSGGHHPDAVLQTGLSA